MALGILQIAKLMKGGFDPDQIAEVLASMGAEASLVSLQPGQLPIAFQQLWEKSQENPGTVFRLELKRGEFKASALIVMEDGQPLPSAESAPSKQALPAAQTA
jgi:hypothetical protein